MLRHVVMFRWRPSTSPATVDAIDTALAGLPDIIEAIRSYRFGADVGLNDTNFDFAVVADFDDVAGYEAYRDDPTHQAVIAELIAPEIAERVAVQYHPTD